MNTSSGRISRRGVLAGGMLGAASLALPGTMRKAFAADPIRIGMPCALTGPVAPVGQQSKRAAELYAKEQNARGGILGRKIELIIEDTQGNPAICVRKAQEMVERYGCRLITGITASSEALAVVPRLEEWGAIFMSSANGDGRLTAEGLYPNFFRSNISGPMGVRVVSLYLRDSKIQKFYALGMDYSWGHSSVDVFESSVRAAGKDFVGKTFTPTGTKDFSTYITRIRQSDAQGLFLVLAGDDTNAFLSQAAQYRLSDRMQLMVEILELSSIKATGDAALGLIGSSRYPFTYDSPLSNQFVARYKAEYGDVPDLFDGEQYQAMQFIQAAIEKTGNIEAKDLRVALENMEIESVKGKVKIRACDHQAVQQGFMVKVARREGFSYPVPEVIATYPGESIVPLCNKSTFG